jgi:hypothetical protein
MQGKGYRTSWDSYKGAFRSGYADNEWDDANTGFFSWAGGSNSTAIGLYALAEDFNRAFRLGVGNGSIGMQDLANVSLAAVKALEERTAELQKKAAEVDVLRAQLAAMEERLAALESEKK